MRSMEQMKMDILIAPTRFLPNVGSQAVADALERGVKRCPDISHVILRPVPEGGRGTMDTVVRALFGRVRRSHTVNAMGRPVDARWAMFPDGTAWVDAAEILGGNEVTDVSRASSWGLGQLIAEIARWKPSRLVIALGDVMTHDGGLGLLDFFGVHGYDVHGRPLVNGVRAVELLDHVGGIATVPDIPMIVLYPHGWHMTGNTGTTWQQGLSKGIAPFQLTSLENHMQHVSQQLEQFWGRALSSLEGSGEGGGLGMALMGLGAQAYSATEYLLDILQMESFWRGVDWVLTAQPTLEATQPFSLAPALARRLRATKIPLIAITERVGQHYEQFYDIGLSGIYPLTDKPRSAKETERSRIHLLEQAAFRVAMWMRALPNHM
ncbi:MAG: hypothetical protein C7B44_01845 [Sulfobacillus thermosulfidooxidans]|nr:MAG: hypothetical protein C7B44_01845 [Sulfobacillus thermosulfidooxidans]